MLAWEGFNRAKGASYAQEAARIGNVYDTSGFGFANPEKVVDPERALRVCADCVVTVEWPAQAEGRMVLDQGLDLPQRGLNKMALALHPSGQADGDLHALLLPGD